MLYQVFGYTYSGFCNTRSNPVNPIIVGIVVPDVFYISNMQPATIEKAKSTTKPCSRLIDLGNGVEILVKNETEARFIVDMIDLAKQGKATLPKSSTVIPIPDNTDIPSDLDWRADYEYSRSDRF